ncbi:purine-nucleoside phosphorylase [Jatrophihabitans endophyticus]|uniref:purine-nucleoside phosphorylase n=1 Tax=Jatrophihabitans endophyticus TaxID=1206085 RepID=UPI0026EB8383|nr:purine-nucleoside phosphorylase [Jatrophihabitans endophyticus]
MPDPSNAEHPADPAGAAADAARALAERTGVASHDIAIVLGSGWVPAVDVLGAADADFPVTDLPGFLPPAVEGHAGRVRSLDVSGRRVLAFLGRTHLYEGRGVEPVVHAVRTAAAAGCRVIVLTNACGGLRPGLAVGDPVLISDHLNLTARTPLVGPRFVDLSDVYAARLRALVREIDPGIAEGVYAQFPGPQYETPAEVRMAGVLGADLVGMSTVLEAVAAHAEGCEVLGISLVTNLAAGLGDPLDHEEVLAVGQASAVRMGELLARLLPRV